MQHLFNHAPPSTRIWLGFSGGLDSSALLHLLQGYCQAKQLELRAIHVHHGLHPDADQWAAHAQQQCQTLSVPLLIERVQLSVPEHNIEQQARQLRYAAFEKHLKPGDALALAHHQDDVAETFLLRLMRGSGTRALANMQVCETRQQYFLWRPLLHCTRTELEHFAKQQNLLWIEDSSNTNTGFDRNFIRHEILPRLQQRFKHVTQRIGHSAQLLAEDAALLEPIIAAQLQHCLSDNTLNGVPLMRCEPAMQAHIVRRWLEQQEQPCPSKKSLHTFLSQLHQHRHDDALCLQHHNYQLRVWQNRIYVRPCTIKQWPDFMCYWDGLQPLQLPRGGTLSWTHGAPYTVRVCYRSGGERMHLMGRKHSHSVKKCLSVLVPPWHRDRLPFIYNEQGALLAVADVLQSQQLAALQMPDSTPLLWQFTETFYEQTP